MKANKEIVDKNFKSLQEALNFHKGHKIDDTFQTEFRVSEGKNMIPHFRHLVECLTCNEIIWDTHLLKETELKIEEIKKAQRKATLKACKKKYEQLQNDADFMDWIEKEIKK